MILIKFAINYLTFFTFIFVVVECSGQNLGEKLAFNTINILKVFNQSITLGRYKSTIFSPTSVMPFGLNETNTNVQLFKEQQ